MSPIRFTRRSRSCVQKIADNQIERIENVSLLNSLETLHLEGNKISNLDEVTSMSTILLSGRERTCGTTRAVLTSGVPHPDRTVAGTDAQQTTMPSAPELPDF